MKYYVVFILAELSALEQERSIIYLIYIYMIIRYIGYWIIK